MARKRSAASDAAEQTFVQRLAQTLLASSPHVDPQVTNAWCRLDQYLSAWPAADEHVYLQDPAVGRAFSIAVDGLPNGPHKKALQVQCAGWPRRFDVPVPHINLA